MRKSKRLLITVTLATMLTSCPSTPIDYEFPAYKQQLITQTEEEQYLFSLLRNSRVERARKLSFNYGVLEKLRGPYDDQIIYHLRLNLPDFIGPANLFKEFHRELKRSGSPEENLKAYNNFIEMYKDLSFKFEGREYNINKSTIVITRWEPKIYVLVDTNKDRLADRIADELPIDHLTWHITTAHLNKIIND